MPLGLLCCVFIIMYHAKFIEKLFLLRFLFSITSSVLLMLCIVKCVISIVMYVFAMMILLMVSNYLASCSEPSDELAVLHACEEGWCGNCVVDYLDGGVDHRDEVLDDLERESKLQVCVSRALPGEKIILDL